MRNGLEERRRRDGFGLSRDIDRLDNQRLKGVGFRSAGEISAKACPAMPPLRSELAGRFPLLGAKLPIPTQLVAGSQQFAPDPSRGAHKWPYRQNSKSLPAGSNSSKKGLTIRGMFTTSDQTRE
jgi:hypothetical protein